MRADRPKRLWDVLTLMAPPAASFARAAPGVRSARAPERSTGPLRECEHLRVYRGQLADGDEVLLVTLSPGLSKSGKRSFDDILRKWDHDRLDSMATVRGRGEAPRPWVALDVAGEQLASRSKPLAVGEVTAILEDAAEAFHVLARRSAEPLPTAAHVLGTRRPPGATVLPPFDLIWEPVTPRRASDEETPDRGREAVARLGRLGRELLTGDAASQAGSVDSEPASLADWTRSRGEEGHQTVEVIESALATDVYRSPYDLKRALLFGDSGPQTAGREATTTTTAGPPPQGSAPSVDDQTGGSVDDQTDGSGDDQANAGAGGQTDASRDRQTDGSGDGKTGADAEAATRAAAGGAGGPDGPAGGQPDGQGPPKPVTRGNDRQEVVSRRKAVGLLGLGLLTVGGVSAVQSTFGGGGSQQTASGDDRVQIPDAEFEFESNPSEIVVRHVAGDRIEASRLFIRRPQVSGVDHLPWSGYPNFTDRSTIWIGDSVTVDRGIPMGLSVVWDRPEADEFVILDEFPTRERESS